MRPLALLNRGYQLMLLSITEITLPAVRMLILSHTLSLAELGFASALAASLALFEGVTDFAIYRFAFTSPRDQYDDAMSGAHGLAVTRSFVVGALAVATAPLVAWLLSLPNDWPSFAMLGGVIAIRGFENYAPRVAERDYRYGAQLTVTASAAFVTIAVLILWVHRWPSHTAVLASFFSQSLAIVVVSNLVAKSRWRPTFFTQQYYAAFRFGYPLAANQLGLSISQADRLIVGALLGMTDLAIYSIVTLVTQVSIALLGRVTSTVTLSLFFNSIDKASLYAARIRLASTLLPLVFALYTVSILTLLNILTPVVFGSRFSVTAPVLVLLALSAFVRLLRGDPFASALLVSGRTKRLAVGNVAAVSSMLFIALFAYFYRHQESAFLGRLVGESISFVVTFYLTQRFIRYALPDHIAATTVGLVVIALVSAACLTTSVGTDPLKSGGVLAAALVGLACYGLRALPTARAAFPKGISKTTQIASAAT